MVGPASCASHPRELKPFTKPRLRATHENVEAPTRVPKEPQGHVARPQSARYHYRHDLTQVTPKVPATPPPCAVHSLTKAVKSQLRLSSGLAAMQWNSSVMTPRQTNAATLQSGSDSHANRRALQFKHGARGTPAGATFCRDHPIASNNITNIISRDSILLFMGVSFLYPHTGQRMILNCGQG